MKDPSRSSTSPSIINEDVIINGHSHEDDNPFAEYMWMENEEEFNRQLPPTLGRKLFFKFCFQFQLAFTCFSLKFLPSWNLPSGLRTIPSYYNHLISSPSFPCPDFFFVKSNLNPNAKEFVPGVKYVNL
uniref:Polyadenylate-binding protein-interacting protein 2 n=1 Tax=Otolemur garnettii TaxID=30611 RepID=H0X327_OTOGA